MSKNPLMDRQMSDAAYIEQAANWSKDLTRMRTRGPGDIENAMRAIERDYGVDYWFLWQLRYTPNRIRNIGVSIYVRLHAAYLAECERQARKHQYAIQITEATVGPHHPAVIAAKALVGTDMVDKVAGEQTAQEIPGESPETAKP